MSDVSTGLFAYPWDLTDEGVGESVGRIQRLGFDRIALNVSYHSGRFFHPRHRDGRTLPRFTGVVNHRAGAGISFRPTRELYGAIEPSVDRPLADANAIPEATAAMRDRGMRFDAWTVVLHNSTLGARHLDHCSRNVFGDPYPYALCPAVPEVRDYAKALVEDICTQFAPDTIALESPTYLGFVHGEHHELVLEDLDDTSRWLLSLCFHPNTLDIAEESGVDRDALRRVVTRVLEELVEHPRGPLPAEFRAPEIASLLLAEPQLYAYLRARNEIVTSLLRELHEIANRHGVRLTTTTSIFERPTSRAWSEGVSLADASSAVDALTSVSYFPDPELVRADIRWMKLHIGDKAFDVALNAGHPDALGEANLTEKAHIARDEGASAITFYNYGLLTTRRLGWLSAANRSLGKEVDMDPR